MEMKNIKALSTLLATALFSAWAWAQQPVNVNTADADELAEALKGVGKSKAAAIVEYRDQNGAFKHVDELVNVKGIGIRTVDINRDYIQLSDAEPAPAGGK
jgi:competence protein ComEA